LTGRRNVVSPNAVSPWVRDSALLSVAVWWAGVTHGGSDDLVVHIRREYQSLLWDLRREVA
jgi:hypothetical protein